MRKIGILLLVVIMATGIVACEKDTEPVEQQVKESIEPIEETITEDESKTEPAPASNAVSAEFFDKITKTPFETITEGIDSNLYEPIIEHIEGVTISEEKQEGRSKYKVQYNITEASPEKLKDLYESALGISFDSNEDNFNTIYEDTSILIFANEWGTIVDLYIPAKTNPDIKGIDYYAGQIEIPAMSQDAQLISCCVQYSIGRDYFSFNRDYLLPQDKAQSIMEEYDIKLSSFDMYSSEPYAWGDEKGVEYSATLSPGVDLCARSHEDLVTSVNINIHAITLFDTEYVISMLKDPASALLSQRAIDIYNLVEFNKRFISVTKYESYLFNHVYLSNIANADKLESLILNKLNPEDPSGSLKDKGRLFIEEYDSFVEIEGERLPDELSINVESSDQLSIDKMNAIFDNFPDDLFPIFPDTVPGEFEGDCICIGEKNDISFQRTYFLELEDYDRALDYFKEYLQTEYGQIDEYIDKECNEVNLSTKLDGVCLDIQFNKNEEDNWASVRIEINKLDQ